jgi:hypothetical protein
MAPRRQGRGARRLRPRAPAVLNHPRHEMPILRVLRPERVDLQVDPHTAPRRVAQEQRAHFRVPCGVGASSAHAAQASSSTAATISLTLIRTAPLMGRTAPQRTAPLTVDVSRATGAQGADGAVVGVSVARRTDMHTLHTGASRCSAFYNYRRVFRFVISRHHNRTRASTVPRAKLLILKGGTVGKRHATETANRGHYDKQHEML